MHASLALALVAMAASSLPAYGATNQSAPLRMQTFTLSHDRAYQCACEPLSMGSHGIPFYGQCTPDLFQQPNHPCHSMLNTCHSCAERVQLHRRADCSVWLKSDKELDAAVKAFQDVVDGLKQTGAIKDPKGKLPVDPELALDMYLNMHPNLDAYTVVRKGLRVDDSTVLPPDVDKYLRDRQKAVENQSPDNLVGELDDALFKSMFMAEAGYLTVRGKLTAQAEAEYAAYKAQVKRLEIEMEATMALISKLTKGPARPVTGTATEPVSAIWTSERWVDKTTGQPVERTTFSEYRDTVMAAQAFRGAETGTNAGAPTAGSRAPAPQDVASRLQATRNNIEAAIRIMGKVVRQQGRKYSAKTKAAIKTEISSLQAKLQSTRGQLRSVAYRWTQLMKQGLASSKQHLQPLRKSAEDVYVSMKTAVDNVRTKMAEWVKERSRTDNNPSDNNPSDDTLSDFDEFDDYLEAEVLPNGEFVLPNE